ncbi:MAG TPA: transporter substrate-binding domain-containing protein [Rugosimonospora sp.]
MSAPGAQGESQAGPPATTVSRRRAVVRLLRLGAIVTAVVLVVVVGVTLLVRTGPPSKDDLMRQAGLVGKSQLLVGVLDDEPGISVRDPQTGQYSGFDIDMTYLVASDLGFDRASVRFLPIQSKDRARMQAQDGDQFVTVDLVAASYSITADRAAQPGVAFSASYLSTAQSVMTRRGHAPVQAWSDLQGERVCTITTSTSLLSAQQNVVKVYRNKVSECVDDLLAGKIDAVTTDAAILAGFVHAHPGELMLNALGVDFDEQWGMNVGDNTALRTLVDLSLYHSRYDSTDRRWEEAFDRDLRPEQHDSLPQEVANDRQPPVAKVRVREWPWQK